MRRIPRIYAVTAIKRAVASRRTPVRHFSRSIRLYDEVKRDEAGHIDVDDLLFKPTWSVRSLMPSEHQSMEAQNITSKQLRHLLRLSALPPPKDAEEEEKMLSTLSSQLHFVKEIQKVDTTGVEPLRSLRDETMEGEREAEIGMDAMKDALAKEEIRGRHHKRIRRRRDPAVIKEDDEWDPLGTASKTSGRFFVVEGGKNG